MIPLLNTEQTKKLHIKAPWHSDKCTDSLIESVSARFAGQTVDIELTEGMVRRLYFGVNVILGRVAMCSEVLRRHGI